MICRHCHHAPVSRPRGLCWVCYYTPGVRDLFPSTSKFGRRGHANHNDAPPLATLPTLAPPGSPEKIAVLEERARLHQALWHPGDARLPEALPFCRGPEGSAADVFSADFANTPGDRAARFDSAAHRAPAA